MKKLQISKIKNFNFCKKLTAGRKKREIRWQDFSYRTWLIQGNRDSARSVCPNTDSEKGAGDGREQNRSNEKRYADLFFDHLCKTCLFWSFQIHYNIPKMIKKLKIEKLMLALNISRCYNTSCSQGNTFLSRCYWRWGSTRSHSEHGS